MKDTDYLFHTGFIESKGFSYALWVLNILQVCCAILEVALTDLGIVMSQAFYELSAINLGIGGGIIIARMIIGLVSLIQNSPSKAKETEKVS